MEKRVVFLNANDNAKMEVIYNLISMPRVQSSSDQGMGVRINHNPNSSNNEYVIYNNIFTRGKYQIYGMGLNRGLYVMGNDFYPGLPVDGSGCMKASVFLEESNEECYIVDNKIDGEDSTDINGSPQISLSNFKDRQTRGVLLRNSNGVIAYCNTLKNLGIAFDLHMDCTGDTIVGNRIIKNHVGLMSRGAAATSTSPGFFTDWGDNNFSYGNVFREWSTTGNPYTAISGGTARLVSVDYGNGGTNISLRASIYYLNSYEDPGASYIDNILTSQLIPSNLIPSGTGVDTAECGYDRTDSERNIANILYGQNGQFQSSMMSERMAVESAILDQYIESATANEEDEVYVRVKHHEQNKKRILFLQDHPELEISSGLIADYLQTEEVCVSIEVTEVDMIKRQLTDTILRRDLSVVESLVQEGLMENADILSTEYYLENEKAMNEIYLTTLALGIDTFTFSQKQFINELAIQCPLIAGKAVYTARMLQLIYMPEMLYEDDCDQTATVARRLSKPKTNKLEYKLMPNPAETHLWLIHPAVASGTEIQIINLQGIEMIRLKPQTGSMKTWVYVNELPQGTYVLRIKEGLNTVYTVKWIKL
jgi:hypothetical protein